VSLSVDKSLIRNYADYYDRDRGLSEWRRLGAVDKCSNILTLCSALEHDHIVEIGCGEGAILERLAQLGFGLSLTGLDISASAVSSTRQKNIPRTNIQVFDGCEIPFGDIQFDLAILSHVLEHVEYPRKLIYEAARIAKNVFVEVPLEDNWRMPGNFVFDRVGHINFYSRKTIRQLVQSCGLEVKAERLSHSSRECYAYRKGALKGGATYLAKQTALAIAPRMASRMLTYHFALVGSKVRLMDPNFR
jgi:ubiquinone/menaquinone biosynthesis C-methylase UbiE